MVKNALKILVISVTLVSCTINPTYKRKDIEKTIEKICKEEFNIDVTTFITGETIWIYAPFYDLVNPDKSFNEKAREKIEHIFLSLKRVVLSMDKPPKFFAFVASDIKNIGVDIYQIGFVPDIVKFELQFISQKELQNRMVFIPTENHNALGDEKGLHVTMNEITMGDFITYLVLQKLMNTYYKESENKYVSVNTIDGNYQYGKITIIVDITHITASKNKIPSPFSTAEKSLIHYLNIYKEFTADIDYVEIIDKSSGKKRLYTIKALLEKDY